MKEFNKKDSFFMKVYNKWSILSSGFKNRFFSKKEIQKIKNDKNMVKSLFMSENMSVNNDSLKENDLLNIGFIESSTICEDVKEVNLDKFLDEDFNKILAKKTFLSPKKNKKIKKNRNREFNSIFHKNRFLTN